MDSVLSEAHRSLIVGGGPLELSLRLLLEHASDRMSV